MLKLREPEKWSAKMAAEACLGMGPPGADYFRAGVRRVAYLFETIEKWAYEAGERNGREQATVHVIEKQESGAAS